MAGLGDTAGQPGARRVEQQGLGIAHPRDRPLDRCLDPLDVVASRPLGIAAQIGCGGGVGLDRDDALEAARQLEREEAGAREEIGGKAARAGRRERRLEERVAQTRVRLEEDAR
jgi:hypothetical protein